MSVYLHTYLCAFTCPCIHPYYTFIRMKKCKHPHTQKIYSQEVVLSGVDFRHVNISAIVMECDGNGKAHQRTAPRSGLRLPSVAAELQVSSISCEGRAAMNKKLSAHTIYLVKNGVLRGFPYHATYSDYLESPTYFMIENSEVENFKVGAELSASSKESTHKRSKKNNREGNLIIFLTMTSDVNI